MSDPLAAQNASKVKKTKNQKRREKLKERKKAKELPKEHNAEIIEIDVKSPTTEKIEQEADYDQIVDTGPYDNLTDMSGNEELYLQFKSVFDRFSSEALQAQQESKDEVFYSDEEEEMSGSDEETNEYQNTKRKLRKVNRVPLAQLKAMSKKPDLIQWYDADARDAVLLAEIKCAPFVVQVPEHWQDKSEYLSRKRGFKKLPFELPKFIRDTGIMDMRDALAEDESTLKQRSRERVQPKMGKLDIDYQKLHDAFFRFQTKPRLYKVGEVYYEGKEDEKDYSAYRPGKISMRLANALGMPSPDAPPPYLFNMQTYGLPPSYQGLKFPGINAPIPPGSQWGFQPGGWGQPPRNDDGKLLYPEVEKQDPRALYKRKRKPVEEHWGDMQEIFIEENEEEEDEEEEEEEDDHEGEGYVDEEAAIAHDKMLEEKEAQKQVSSPETIDLRKDTETIELRKDTALESNEEQSKVGPSGELYTVLSERSGSGFMGTQRAYILPQSNDKKTDSGEFQKELEDLIASERDKHNK